MRQRLLGCDTRSSSRAVHAQVRDRLPHPLPPPVGLYRRVSSTIFPHFFVTITKRSFCNE